MDDIQFLPMEVEDRDFFIHVHHTAYRETIEKQFGWDEEIQDNFANQAFDAGGVKVITLAGKKVGVVGWEEYNDYMWLKEFFLLPEFQGRGIGSEIIQRVKSKAKELSKPLRLQPLKENVRAKSLYEKHGFKVIELTDIHWKMEIPYQDT